jgi:hypothetical protein
VAMYSAASFAIGRLVGADRIVALARGWASVALVVWVVVLAGMYAHGRRPSRRPSKVVVAE